ncbi:transcription factor HIVEP3 isoform X2 [Lates calcarifer]|uniref:Transcription factor HIVEP3 isoform X2 n=1 Tax=Lates calcarifer TaxID=8187 RepID=A0AAJ7V9P2_LATCA|nr:transcription factor HIVEP3 isoform X2 [Lates calcarifer]
MEAEPSRPADGERSGRQEQQHVTAESSLGSCPPQQPQQPPNPRPVHRALGRLQNRQPKRTDLLLRLQQQQAVGWQHPDSPGPSSGGSFYSPASSSTSSLRSTSSTRGEPGHGVLAQSSQEGLEGVSSPRRGEKKPQKPGKYVCTYCGRPCAKPSVLQKHIRSHTGERPYPCAPCGFSFKTKSNLYKHRKSHAHRIKAGLASSRDEPSLSGPEGSGVGEDPEEHTEGESTESEEETGQHRKSSKEMLGQQKKGSKEVLGGSEESQRPEDSQAVKQRLALRLSERKRGPMASPDDPPSSLSTSSSSLGPGSKGSTESGYFSGSGSTDLSQVSPPSASAKTYAEIILGKYGRLGGQQRSPHQQQPHSSLSSSSGTEEKSIPFAVPKTQVIEHITKLITINEAVVDTSEIDSVKPRRSSLSRKSSMESPKFSAPKDPYAFDPKGETPGPSGLRHLHNPEADPAGSQELSSVPLLRSHSMPSSTSQGEPSTSGTMSPRGYRLCQSFDEQQAVVAEMRVGHAQRMLRRQPAIEVPLGAEVMLEEAGPTSSSSSSYSSSARATELTRQPQQQQQQQQKIPSLFECEACRARFQHSEGYEAHRGICSGQQTLEQESGDVGKTCREDRPQMMMHYKFRALAMAVRKRRKEESLEEDPPSPGSVTMSGSSAGLIPVPSRPEHSQALSGVSLQTEPKQQQQQQDRKGVSVIQHTSSFEKQESISMESQEPDLRESQQTQQPEPKPSPSTSRLIRQPNIQVPEILVTVEPDADMPSVSPPVTASSSKEAERVEEFQWPQRSQTLAQLPAEKLPPKKKRLRLAEAAQSSGESSFESVSLSRSPSQESNISHASSLSASFEDAARSEGAAWAVSSQSSQMLMVPPASHQHHQSHKEMRRSASEQAPASPQQTEQISETRSKSFDYGSLSSQQSTSAWKERRKCLLVKHATLGEPEQEEGASRAESPKPGPSRPILPPLYSTEASPRFSLEATGKALQLLQPQIFPPPQDVLPLQPRAQQAFPPGSLSQLLPVTTAFPTEVLSTQIIHRAFIQSQSGPPHIQINPAQIHMAEQLGLPFQQLPALVPLQFSSRTRASQTLYLPVPPRLPSLPAAESRPSISSMSSDLTRQSLVTISYHHPQPVIATCLAQLTPVVSLVVPVRLQTHIPTYASAMYTTLSQILASTRSQEPISCTAMVIMGQVEREKLQRSYLKVPSPDIILPLSLPTELASGSGEGYGPLGAGGSKRMLSPAASLELSTEAQRHQKRVKEEGEGEQHKAGEEEEEEEEEEEDGVQQKVREEEENKATGRKLEEGERKQPEREEVTTVKADGKQEQVPRKHNREEKEEMGKELTEKSSQKKEEVPAAGEGVGRPSTPSYPSLHTSTTVNWCYRNYVKPNPSAQRDPRASVYSTWSVSAHNPNLPGLSTKVVLSLLCSKQKHSTETYTMATAPTPAKSELSPSNRTPHVSEVHATPPSTVTEVKDQQQQQQQQQQENEENKEMKDEEGPSTSKQGEPSRVRIFEGGYKSNEEYVYVRGRGRGKYICGECGIRCKKPSMLKKHIRTHTDVRPYICKHCNFAFKTKGNLTKHMKSKAHGKKCQAMGVSESSLDEPESEETGSDERVCGSEEQEEHQFSDVEESEDDDDNDDDDDEEEESASHDDPPSSCSSDTHLSTGGHSSCSRHSKQGTPDPEHPPGPSPSPGKERSPRGVWPSSRRAASPGSRRALFSRRGWKASPRAFSPSSESCSPSRSLSPRLELSSPIHSLSPRTELSSPSRHVSPSPERGPSPIRPLSPLRPISPSCYRSSQARTPPPPLGLQHRTTGYLPWESPSSKGSQFKLEKSGTAGKGSTFPEASLFPPAFRLSTCEGYPGHQAADNIFSHLPMHSQQAKVPYLMIPIGGIQMVQARPRSHPTTPSSPTSPPMEGPSLARFESYWGGTPRIQGLRTPGDHWSEHQAAGTSQSGRCSFSTALTCSKPELETTDSKQYGSSHSSAQNRRSATETTERCVRDSCSRAPLSRAASVVSRVTGQQAEGEEPPSGSDLVEGGAKGDSARTDQST